MQVKHVPNYLAIVKSSLEIFSLTSRTVLNDERNSNSFRFVHYTFMVIYLLHILELYTITTYILIFFQDFLELPTHKMLHPSQTRWLSLVSVVQRILEQWEALEVDKNFLNS